MKNKTIVIAGAGKGIGLSIAGILAAENNVISLSRNLTEELEELNTNFHQIDVVNDSLESIEVPEEVHALFYCPGSINLKPFNRLSANDFMKDYQQSVIGAVQIIQKFLPALKKSGNAGIVLFSTVAVQTGMPFHASVAAAKGAIEGLGRSLAAEFASLNIRVNVIAPSLTDTPLASNLLSTPEKREASAKRHPLQRIGTADEIAQTAVYLVSENASWITGQVIGVDGGMSSLKV
jgi:3-oxoacyl-[acyl-carrier protein] reductase